MESFCQSIATILLRSSSSHSAIMDKKKQPKTYYWQMWVSPNLVIKFFVLNMSALVICRIQGLLLEKDMPWLLSSLSQLLIFRITRTISRFLSEGLTLFSFLFILIPRNQTLLYLKILSILDKEFSEMFSRLKLPSKIEIKPLQNAKLTSQTLESNLKIKVNKKP